MSTGKSHLGARELNGICLTVYNKQRRAFVAMLLHFHSCVVRHSSIDIYIFKGCYCLSNVAFAESQHKKFSNGGNPHLLSLF